MVVKLPYYTSNAQEEKHNLKMELAFGCAYKYVRKLTVVDSTTNTGSVEEWWHGDRTRCLLPMLTCLVKRSLAVRIA